jgi:hypothetical protein
VKKRSLSRRQNLSCEKRRQIPRISAAAKFGMSAHRADFREFGGSKTLAGHCGQPPIACAYPEVASHLDCLRQKRAWLGGSGEF